MLPGRFAKQKSSLNKSGTSTSGNPNKPSSANSKSSPGILGRFHRGSNKRPRSNRQSVRLGLYFGQSLTPFAAEKVPPPIKETADELTQNHLDLAGIFRIPGSVAEIKEMKSIYDKGESVPLQNYSPHSVGGVFKLFLRELPDPIFPYECYDMCVSVNSIKDPEAKTKQLINILSMVSLNNYNVLKFTFNFLYTISTHSDLNKMTANNLAICFTPNLLKPLSDDLSVIMKETVADFFSKTTFEENSILKNAATTGFVTSLIEGYPECFVRSIEDELAAYKAEIAQKSAISKNPEPEIPSMEEGEGSGPYDIIDAMDLFFQDQNDDMWMNLEAALPKCPILKEYIPQSYSELVPPDPDALQILPFRDELPTNIVYVPFPSLSRELEPSFSIFTQFESPDSPLVGFFKQRPIIDVSILPGANLVKPPSEPLRAPNFSLTHIRSRKGSISSSHSSEISIATSATSSNVNETINSAVSRVKKKNSVKRLSSNDSPPSHSLNSSSERVQSPIRRRPKPRRSKLPRKPSSKVKPSTPPNGMKPSVSIPKASPKSSPKKKPINRPVTSIQSPVDKEHNVLKQRRSSLGHSTKLPSSPPRSKPNSKSGRLPAKPIRGRTHRGRTRVGRRRVRKVGQH